MYDIATEHYPGDYSNFKDFVNKKIKGKDPNESVTLIKSTNYVDYY